MILVSDTGSHGACASSEGVAPAIDAKALEALFYRLFGVSENTRLQGGADEPFYRPCSEGEPAVIFYRLDYVRSALHEVAHWCVAGKARRGLPDYGYWYSPDDRDGTQQQAFFAVEARPQALEKWFCEALGLDFKPSIDNLSLQLSESSIAAFNQRVSDHYTILQSAGGRGRAGQFYRGCCELVARSRLQLEGDFPGAPFSAGASRRDCRL